MIVVGRRWTSKVCRRVLEIVYFENRGVAPYILLLRGHHVETRFERPSDEAQVFEPQRWPQVVEKMLFVVWD